MNKCNNQMCKWNTYEYGCIKPFFDKCPLESQKQKTNADRIRAMNDEELAELFQSIIHERDVIMIEKLKNHGIEARLVEAPVLSLKTHMDWLKQPAE